MKNNQEKVYFLI